MRLAIDLDTNQFVNPATNGGTAPTLSVQRGDRRTVELVFVRNGQVQELPTGADGKLQSNVAGTYTTGGIAHDGAWVKRNTGNETVYEFTLDLYTEECEAAFTSGSASVAARLQVRWETPDEVIHSNALELTIHNSLAIVGADPPTSLPTAETWLTGAAVRHDIAQSLDADNQARALSNIGGASAAQVSAAAAAAAAAQSDADAAGILAEDAHDLADTANTTAENAHGQALAAYDAAISAQETAGEALEAASSAGGDMQTVFLGGPGANDSTGELGSPAKPFATISGLIMSATVVAHLAGNSNQNLLTVIVRPKYAAGNYGSLHFNGGTTGHAAALGAMGRVFFKGVSLDYCRIGEISVSSFGSPVSIVLNGNGLVTVGTSLSSPAITLDGQAGTNGTNPTSWENLTIDGSSSYIQNGTLVWTGGYSYGRPTYSGDGQYCWYNGEGAWVLGRDGDGSMLFYGDYQTPPTGTGWDSDTSIYLSGGNPTGGSNGENGTSGNGALVRGFRVLGKVSSISGRGGYPPEFLGFGAGAAGDSGSLTFEDCVMQSNEITASVHPEATNGQAGSVTFIRCRGVVGSAGVSAYTNAGTGGTSPGFLGVHHSAELSIWYVARKDGGNIEVGEVAMSGVNGFIGIMTETFYHSSYYGETSGEGGAPSGLCYGPSPNCGFSPMWRYAWAA